ncbi:MAG: hypothetical protein LC104_06085 [Bacteroidales bacterium]|nr:hypothetical protein [Bacteroidales bacterium]
MTHTLNINLDDILSEKFPNGFHVPADIDLAMLLEFGDDDWSHGLNFDAILEAEDQVALIWSVDDVLARRPDLDEQQAWKVLVAARDDYERNQCHLDFIEATSNGLYPVGECARRQLTRRVETLLKTLETLSEADFSQPDHVAGITSRLEELEKSMVETGGRP